MKNDTIQGIRLNTNRGHLYAVVLIVFVTVVYFIGLFLVMRNHVLPSTLFLSTVNIAYLIGTAVFVYVLIDQWRIATRRKSPGDLPNSKVWFCPYCGKLDVEGGEHCPGCGKPLPRFIATKNGGWAPADSKDPHKVAIGKDRKEV